MNALAPAQAELEQLVTGRATSFFADDVEAARDRIAEGLRGKRVLVVGGGGSIGAATTRAILVHQPACVHVVDVSENYLAELVRDVRSAPVAGGGGGELVTHVFDYGSTAMERFLAEIPRFDAVLNFAAVKHVRSERDVYSLLHMIDVNIVRLGRFKRWLAQAGHDDRLFTVSTDKAANPTNLMGATKRVMEDVAFDVRAGAIANVASARFANVAFSNGSLLQAFLVRLQKRQPLAVPRDTRRYFVSHAEAAEICLLAAFAAPSGTICVPAFDPARHLLPLQDVACLVLERFGYSPWVTGDEAEARDAMASLPEEGRWPLLVTPLDTSGEKAFEEFAGDGERAEPIGFASLLGIRHLPQPRIESLLVDLEALVGDCTRAADKAAIVALLSDAVPTLRHSETGRHLDQRM